MSHIDLDEDLQSDVDIQQYYRVLGQRVRAARHAAGQTQEELGARLGLSRASVTNLEAGRQRVPVHTLAQAAATLQLNIAALIPPLDTTAGSSPALANLRGAPEEHLQLVRRLMQALPEAKATDRA